MRENAIPAFCTAASWFFDGGPACTSSAGIPQQDCDSDILSGSQSESKDELLPSRFRRKFVPNHAVFRHCSVIVTSVIVTSLT
jgi:hypothetical protein